MPGFRETVQKSWEEPVNSLNKPRTLHIKLARLVKALKKWSKERLSTMKQEANDAAQIVLHLDQEQDSRPLIDAKTAEENGEE
jgi:hypothetical protein